MRALVCLLGAVLFLQLPRRLIHKPSARDLSPSAVQSSPLGGRQAKVGRPAYTN